MEYMFIQEYLFANKDEEYRSFTISLIPNIDPNFIVGVKVPLIKNYSKTLNKEEISYFLNSLPHKYHEENLLHAILLSNIKDYDEFINEINRFLPFVNNWAVSDTISNKNLNKYKDKLINEIFVWLKSKEVYRVRYAIKCLMNYYLDKDFKEIYLDKVKEVKLDDYYIKMMIAWYIAIGLAKNYDDFIKVIERHEFDTFINNKSIQKAIESYRVSDEHKKYLKTLKIH